MITEFYIENRPVDIGEDISSLLTLAIDDIKDFSQRSTTWSKTIILPGTAKNNKLLGHIFQVGQANSYNALLPNIGYNFNASKSAACIIFQDNIQTFKGVMRLLQINYEGDRVEYEVAVFGDLFSLNVALTSKLLTALDFSAYNHTYNKDNIIASWDNAPGSGYYYPLIDFGNYSTDKHDWDIRTFRPALYVKEFIDKMFSVAGFRYSAPLFSTDRFKKLIIPNNQKVLLAVNTDLLSVSDPNPSTFINGGPDVQKFDDFIFDTVALSTNFTTPDNFKFVFAGIAPITMDFAFVISGTYRGNQDYELRLEKNDFSFIGTPATIPASVTATPFTAIINAAETLSTGDYFKAKGVMGFDHLPNYELVIDSLTIVISAAVGSTVILNPGDAVDINFNLPKNIRQIDLLVSIVKLFNLYVYEDKFDNRLIHISPYINFYNADNQNAVDWTYKLNRDGAIKVKPMSELNSKIYKFNYAEDSDYYNALYSKRYGQGYGSYIYDSEFEFAQETSEVTLLFAPTPLVGYSGEDKVYSTIFKRTGPDGSEVEEQVDSKVRILQSKKVTDVNSWDIKDGSAVLDSLTDYGYAGHIDDPDVPSNDLNYGALAELFFSLSNGSLSSTQFNVYWSAYMAEITDKDSRLFVGEYHLFPTDIYNLDFSKYVIVDGVLFRLNKISDYNVNKPSLCTVELLKVINTIY